MASYRSPGVFSKEIDASLTIRGAATSVAGMVGVTIKGPVGEPTLVNSWAQFVETFGSFTPNSYLPLAVKSFFDEGGSVLYVVRTVHYDPSPTSSTATYEFDDGAADGPTVLTVSAISPGTWANGLKVEVTDVEVGDGTFTLWVLDEDDNVIERFLMLSMDEDDDRFVETIVNRSSRYVHASAELDDLPDETDGTLAGGGDGLDDLADADFMGDPALRTGLHALDTVDTVKLVAIPGVNSVAVHNYLAAYAENRGTVFAVLGAPQGLTPTAAIGHRDDLAGPYAGLYWPWVTIANPQTGMPLNVPPDGHVLGIIARNDQTAVWSAPAGLDRGRLRTAIGVEYSSTVGERDELYDKAVNVIANFTGKGVVVWGQKVMTAKPSALDRINVRRLINWIKESAARTTKFLLFEPNDERTWQAFILYMEPFLDNIRDRRGLMDFLVVCDETTNTPYYIDQNTMVAKIFVKPTRTAEFIELNYIVTSAGVDFSELL